MAHLTEAQRRKAREEFDRRRRSTTDSTVTSGTNFDSWLTGFVAGQAGIYTTVDPSPSYSDTSSVTESISHDSSSSSYDSGSSSSFDSGSSSSDGGGGGSW